MEPRIPLRGRKSASVLTESYDRSFCPEGMARQNMAFSPVATEEPRSRRSALRRW